MLLAAKTFGWDFFTATNANFINYFYGYTTTAPTVPIWSYPPLLASYLIDNSIFQIGMVVLFGVWFLGWSGTLFLSSTRMIFAAAFDRVLPDHAAQVSERRAVPVIALLYIMVPAVVVSVIYAYSADFRALTLDATLVIAVTFLGSAIAATILPWYKPAIFDNSPVAHLKLVVSGAGLITSIILAWTIYPLAARTRSTGSASATPNSIIFLGVVYGAAALLYVVARLVPPLAGRRPRRHPFGDPGRVAPGSSHDTTKAPRDPRGAVCRCQPPNQPRRAGRRVLPDVLGLAVLVEAARPELAADARLLEAAPLGLRQVRVVVVDPDRAVAQPAATRWARPASAVQTAPARP